MEMVIFTARVPYKIGNPKLPPEIRTMLKFIQVRLNSYFWRMFTPDPFALRSLIASAAAVPMGKTFVEAAAVFTGNLFAAIASCVAIGIIDTLFNFP